MKFEIITTYICTKGVDTMDYMSENYNVARASAFWLLTTSYEMMNIEKINGQIKYYENLKKKI